MMRCLVFVKFLPGGSIAPAEFLTRINARWSWLESLPFNESGETRTQSAMSAICITDYESIEQFSIDLSIMPRAGISNVEVLPVSEEVELVNSGLLNPRLPDEEG